MIGFFPGELAGLQQAARGGAAGGGDAGLRGLESTVVCAGRTRPAPVRLLPEDLGPTGTPAAGSGALAGSVPSPGPAPGVLPAAPGPVMA